jgi:hypothetical protein
VWSTGEEFSTEQIGIKLASTAQVEEKEERGSGLASMKGYPTGC